MAERFAQILVGAFYVYIALGVLFAVAFVSSGAKKIDPQTIGSSFWLRLLLIPGTTAFWPLLLRRWISGSAEPPEERNPHS